ncbi:putative sulfate/molybdate transporter [Desulfosarcina cetonica]|uniref:putative sulfate/molybdate transporter n=1 Tax=Desulfosarcina cetonica TaxID=90730 RepID=UPI003BEEBA7E
MNGHQEATIQSSVNRAASVYRFNRMELAGSLGDLGTILPLAIGMILINGLNPVGLFTGVGIFYILSGLYFKVTTPVEPMKVIGAYAIATGIGAVQIQAASLWIFVFLILIGGSGAIAWIGRYIPKPVIRGVQLSTGVLLVSQGVKLMMGNAKLQVLRHAAEPYLSVQGLGPLPIGLVIGTLLGVLTLLLLENRRLPAAIVVVGAGMLTGLLVGTREGLDQIHIGVNLPPWMPFGMPSVTDFTFALLVLVLPQVPMTLGNAVMANADLSLQYFPENGRRVTYRAVHQHGPGQSAVVFHRRHAHVPRRRRSGVALSLRGPHGRLQSDHWNPFHHHGTVSGRASHGGNLFVAHVRPGHPDDFRRRSIEPHPPGHADAQGFVRAGSRVGHHAGHQPGRRVSDRHCRGLCFEIPAPACLTGS